MSEHRPTNSHDASALAVLRVDVPPSRDLFPEIAARIADPDAHSHCDLPVALAAELKALRRDAEAPPALWEGITARLADADQRAYCALPPALRERLNALTREQAPARDLWPAIAARTVSPPARRNTTRARLWRRLGEFAVAASLLIGVSALIQLERPLGGAPTLAGTPAARAPLRSPDATQLAAFDRRHPARTDLLRAAYRPIPPDARALVRANLKIIDSAEAQIRQAMAADTGDAAYLQGLLDSARAQRAQLRASLEPQP